MVVALAGPAEQLERPVVGAEAHLPGLARIRLHEAHAAAAQPHVRHPQPHRRAAMAAHSWPQTNWNASPGSNTKGTWAPDMPVKRSQVLGQMSSDCRSSVICKILRHLTENQIFGQLLSDIAIELRPSCLTPWMAVL